MSNTINAGWATISITPHGRNVSLAGQYYERITDQVDCELMASVLILRNSKESITWVTCDIVGITDKLLEAVKESVIAYDSRININNLCMNAIHSHNAPFIKYSDILGRSGYFKEKSGLMGDKEYHDFVVNRITQAIISANKKVATGFSIDSGTVNIRTGCNRRGILQNGEGVMYIDTSRADFLKMEGPDGGPIGVLYIKNNDEELKGVVAFLPCTAQILEHEYVMSSDYTGRVRQMFWDKFGDDFVFVPLISAAGDLSPRNLLTKDYGLGDMYKSSGADKFAQKVYDGLVSEVDSCNNEQLGASDFNVKRKRIVLPGWIPTEDEYIWAREILKSDEIKFDIKDYVQKGIEPYYNQPLALAKKAESTIMKFEEKDKYTELEIELFAIQIGNIAWVTNPFELFIEYGNRITAGSTAKYAWPVQLVNGYEGYFPTAEAVKAGGYSAYIQSVRVDPAKAGEILVKESINLINSLF